MHALKMYFNYHILTKITFFRWQYTNLSHFIQTKLSIYLQLKGKLINEKDLIHDVFHLHFYFIELC